VRAYKQDVRYPEGQKLNVTRDVSVVWKSLDFVELKLDVKVQGEKVPLV